MDTRIKDCLEQKEGSYILPFFWQHGEDHGALLEEIEAPVYAGQQVGQIRLTLDEEEVGSVNILAAATVERLTFSRAVGRLLSALFTL